MSRTRLGFRRIKFDPDNDPRLMAESALEFDAASSYGWNSRRVFANERHPGELCERNVPKELRLVERSNDLRAHRARPLRIKYVVFTLARSHRLLHAHHLVDEGIRGDVGASPDSRILHDAKRHIHQHAQSADARAKRVKQRRRRGLVVFGKVRDGPVRFHNRTRDHLRRHALYDNDDPCVAVATAPPIV